MSSRLPMTALLGQPRGGTQQQDERDDAHTSGSDDDEDDSSSSGGSSGSGSGTESDDEREDEEPRPVVLPAHTSGHAVHPSALALPISPLDGGGTDADHTSNGSPAANQRQRRAEELRRVTEAQEEELAYYAAAASSSTSSSYTSPRPSSPTPTHQCFASTLRPAATLPPPPAPSTLSLLHSLQRYHLLCAHLSQSLSHYVQSQSQSLIDLEESLQQSRYVEWMLRLVKESTAGGGGPSHGASGAPFSILSAFTSTSTAQLLNLYSTNCYGALFDKRKMQINKPFGYAQEVEYKRLIHVLRARPSLLSFALASFQWQLIQPATAPGGGGANVLSSHSPLVDPSAAAAHKRSMDSVAKCCVWDLFGADDGGAAAHAAQSKVAYMIRMTLKILWEKEAERTRERSASQVYAALAATQPPPAALPLHIFEHQAFLPRLFHEYNLLAGGDFLNRCLKDVLHIVILYDDCMDLNADLMAMIPPGATPQELEMARINPNCATASTVMFADFPPPSQPPPGSDSSAARTPPLMHGRPTNNLYDLCTTLLEKLSQHVSLMPRGMRRMGREIARLAYMAQFGGVGSGAQTAVATSSLIPPDPNFEHVSTRLLSDYFFLNWIVNAVMFPESYTRGASASLTDNYPLSSLARRNLQAIGTVLIKLTSGSRFSAFSSAAAAAAANISPLRTPATSKLDRFLELHQPSIITWLRRVIDVDPSGEEERMEAALMERADLEASVTIPASWKGEAGTWTAHVSSQPDADLRPIMLLPNDIFAIHGLMKGCWNVAVNVRVASTPTRRKATLTSQPQPTLVPIAKLPLPTFPVCLQAAAAASNPASSCPYSLEILTLLLSSLASLGDVANFVPTNENVYVLLDSGFTPLQQPPELARLREEWPFNEKRMRHAADILLQTLADIPTLPDDPAQACTHSLPTLFQMLTAQHAMSLQPALASQLHGTHAILTSRLSSAWQQDSCRPFLLALQHALMRQHEVLLHSSSISSRMLLNYGVIQKVAEGSTRKDAHLAAQFKLIQLKRLLELTRPKIRRLKKFLATKADPRALSQQSPPSAGAASSPLPDADVPTCAGPCPDNAAQDRFLCTLCSRLLERRRGLLRSFMNKYVIGEGVVILNSPVGSNGSGASINAFAVPEASQASSPTLLVSVGVGPPLDIKEASVAADIADYILASAYPELFVRCGKADDTFYTRTNKLADFFQHNFTSFFVYMQLMDLMPDAAKALEAWYAWREAYRKEPHQPDAAGVSLGLAGHEPILIHLPGSSKPKQLRVPYLGVHAVSQAYQLLRTLDSEIKPKRKLDACVSVRALLLTTLGTMSFTDLSCEPIDRSPTSASVVDKMHERISNLNPFAAGTAAPLHFHPLHPSNHGGSAPDDVDAGSVEDYMSSLCYLLLLSNPPFLLSNLSFLKTMYGAAAGASKAFVDLLVAMRYLDGVWTSLAPIIAAKEAEEEARKQHEREERERREKHRSEEAALAQQAQELSMQIQQAQEQLREAAEVAANSALDDSHPLSSVATSNADLRARLSGMGFGDAEITASLRLLSEQDRAHTEAAFEKMLDHLTAK